MSTNSKIYDILHQCTPLPLFKKKTSSPWPLMVSPLVLLPQDLASASPQYPGLSELSISISPIFLTLTVTRYLAAIQRG